MISENKIVLFPIAGQAVSYKQKEFILKKFSDVSLAEIEEYLRKPASEDEISTLCEEIDTEEKRQDLFEQAKTICEIKGITHYQLERLALLGEVLLIDEMHTGFEFSLYDKSQREDYVFQLLLIRFAVMSAVVEIMPLGGVLSCVAVSSLQTMLATKVAEVYDFDLDINHFMKIACGSAGISLLFKGIGNGISRLLPFKLMWRASSVFASSYAVGITAKAYIGANGVINADNLRGIWESALEEGKSIFKQFRSYICRNKKYLANELKKSIAAYKAPKKA